jgi:hypothetical protein
MELDYGVEDNLCCRQSGGAGKMGHLPGETNQRPSADYKRMKLGEPGQTAGTMKMEVVIQGNKLLMW